MNGPRLHQRAADRSIGVLIAQLVHLEIVAMILHDVLLSIANELNAVKLIVLRIRNPVVLIADAGDIAVVVIRIGGHSRTQKMPPP